MKEMIHRSKHFWSLKNFLEATGLFCDSPFGSNLDHGEIFGSTFSENFYFIRIENVELLVAAFPRSLLGQRDLNLRWVSDIE